MDQILWEEWNHPNDSVYGPAALSWLVFTVVVVFVLRRSLFLDDGAAVKYNVLAPTYPSKGDESIDGSSTEAETGPEVSVYPGHLRCTLTHFRSGTAKYFLVAQQTADAWGPL